MASDFTVLFDDRLHFGSHPGYFNDETIYPIQRLGPGVTFVGADKTILFDTPNIDLKQSAVLMYQSFDVTVLRNIIKLNDAEIPGGIPVDANRCEWKSNLFILAPGSLMKDRTNTLYIEARGESVDAETNRDNFVLTSAVIFYKTVD
jgi:hypothetical protein